MINNCGESSSSSGNLTTSVSCTFEIDVITVNKVYIPGIDEGKQLRLKQVIGWKHCPDGKWRVAFRFIGVPDNIIKNNGHYEVYMNKGADRIKLLAQAVRFADIYYDLAELNGHVAGR